MSHDVALVWVLYRKESCGEASQTRVLVQGTLPQG